MKRQTKIWIIIAASLVVIGAILFAGVMWALDWDFTKLSTDKYKTNTYEINEDFSAVSIDADTADIKFLLADNGKCRVVCFEEEKEKHTATVLEDTLTIKKNGGKAWYDYIGINFETPKITVYLPKTEYDRLTIEGNTGEISAPKDFIFKNADISLSTGDVVFSSCGEQIKIKTGTGNISLSDITAEDIDLSVSTGKTYLKNINCKNLLSSGNTGDIYLDSVIAAEKISVRRSTGDVKFEKSDAGEIFVETDTGDVEGSLLSDKVFITETDTGSINLPKSSAGGRCEIATDTGDIEIDVIS